MGCGRSQLRTSFLPEDLGSFDKPIYIEITFGGNAAPYGTNSAGPKDGTPMAGLAGWNGGSGNGGVGRTMKEYEDLLGSLQKENFNLKLRIYFLEEQAGISQTDQDVVKKNIELNVEMESMKKELMEKQELLSQAAKAFELIEEQKEATARDQAQRQQLFEKEREKVAKLEKELAECRERDVNASMYYKETFGITPEQALENAEKLRQMEELVASLEAEEKLYSRQTKQKFAIFACNADSHNTVQVKQINSSLEEERSWAQELENERDQLRERLDVEVRLREKQDTDRVRDIDLLREKVKELDDQLFKKDTVVQQYRNDLVECDRLVKEKSALLLEKCQAYEELNLISEKRKQQIVQLRASVKTRDDALTDLNYKHRTLLSQCENNYGKRSPSSSPSTLNSLACRLSPPMGQKPSCIRDIMDMDNTYMDFESYKEKTVNLFSPLQTIGEDTKEVSQLTKELEERDNELKRQEEARKQLILRLCNTQKQAENTEQRLKKMEGEHEKAIRAIQGFMEREKQARDANTRKERRILELEMELRKLRDSDDTKVRADEHDLVLLKDLGDKNVDGNENSSYKQQRFEEMESNINDLRGEIETIKTEKNLLEKRIQAESEELQERLHDKEQKIEILETEKQTVAKELTDKIIELDKLRHAETNTSIIDDGFPRKKELLEQLKVQNTEIEEKNRKIEQLTKDLQVKTQNLQKLVNTELWSKNKEIAKLHNHMTASYSPDRCRNKPETVQETGSSQLTSLIRELSEIGIRATFVNETACLNYINEDGTVDMKTLSEYVRRLTSQKNDLEKEVDYLKWLKLVSKPDIGIEIDGCSDDSEWAKKYCELLRTHLKDLMKFMKEMLKNAERADTAGTEHKKMVLDVLFNSKMLSDDFVRALDDVSVQDGVDVIIANDRLESSGKKTRPEDIAETVKNQASQSDSEAFSEPDRTVSMARIGLQETQHKIPSRFRFSKYIAKTHSDSEDSTDYVPYYKTYQNDLNDLDMNHQIQELKETNNMLYSELSALRNDLVTKVSFDCTIDEKLTPFIMKLEKSQRFCEKLQVSLEKRIHEFHTLKKQNSIRKTQLEKKINDMEQMASEMTKQQSELLQFRENNDKKTTDTLLILNKENESLRARIKQLEEEAETAKATISTLRRELEHLTLSHSEIFVENSKLTNDKLRLEQEIRKMESRYDVTVRSLHDKFSKEISDLNQINDSHRARVQELETANKEFRRHMAVCEASDSAPSSSGVSSIPTDTTLKQTCDDILQEYQPYNNSQYWQLTNYSTMGARSKSSCSPDLGIESDAAVTTVRPLKDTLKITESMTNLLSDEENGNGNHRTRDANSQSPLPIEGLDEVEALKQENESLKRRLMKTRRALEDTFEHLSASNKNKKNVEKAIIKQLMITKNVLKKTRTFEEPLND
ncbi:centrosomin isoform X3 [Harpegnathos saltator]|uniref:centrosomin isoform X3 n=1 Tax=Harpegnathos saltator TaxID=610380 RepID=UPI000DBEE4A5|nr:centrosomin isoform X3 [Harpegnathos saltator]